MKNALILEVKHRSDGSPLPAAPVLDCHAFTRSKVAPMVNGLFPEHERTNVLEMLERSVVFLTSENILDVLLRNELRTSWKLANIYLSSIGGNILCKKAECIVGLSEETTCYVSHEYFHQQIVSLTSLCTRLLTSFITAGAFQSASRNQNKGVLAEHEFCQRETFAYACEVYSRILEITRCQPEGAHQAC